MLFYYKLEAPDSDHIFNTIADIKEEIQLVNQGSFFKIDSINYSLQNKDEFSHKLNLPSILPPI